MRNTFKSHALRSDFAGTSITLSYKPMPVLNVSATVFTESLDPETDEIRIKGRDTYRRLLVWEVHIESLLYKSNGDYKTRITHDARHRTAKLIRCDIDCAVR